MHEEWWREMQGWWGEESGGLHVSAPPRVQSAISWSENAQHRVLLTLAPEMEQLATHCGGGLEAWTRLKAASMAAVAEKALGAM
jgi:hypothetical protein